MDVRIMGSPCPKCGGCDYYCAECYDEEAAQLEAVAQSSGAMLRYMARAEKFWDDLRKTLEALDKQEAEEEGA